MPARSGVRSLADHHAQAVAGHRCVRVRVALVREPQERERPADERHRARNGKGRRGRARGCHCKQPHARVDLGPEQAARSADRAQVDGPLSVDASRFEWTSFYPSVAPQGHDFAFQAALIAANGALSLSLPSPYGVSWVSGRSL